MSTGRLAGSSPCIKCPAGVLCSGLPVQEVVVSPVPFVDVPTQFILAKMPLAPVDSMVSLFKGVDANMATLRTTTLPDRNSPVFIRQVCRGNLCMACEDDTATCIRSEVVVLQSLPGGYSANITSLKRDVLYRFIASDCAALGISGLDAEYVSADTVIISSVIEVSSMRAVCNSSHFVDIPVDTY
jgi:hypothetical protein